MKTPSLLILIFFSFLSCSESDDTISQNFIYQYDEERSVVRTTYFPSENNLQIPISLLEFWKIKLSDENEIISSTIYHYNDSLLVLLFDSLANKEYTLKCTSVFSDNLEFKIDLNRSKFNSPPKELTNFYQDLKLDTSFLNNFDPRDTISLHYRQLGCFAGYKRTFKIYNSQDHLVINENDTIIPIKDFEIKFEKFISELGEVEEKYKEARCTSSDTYLIKSQNKVSRIVDNSCQWSGLLRLLENT